MGVGDVHPLWDTRLAFSLCSYPLASSSLFPALSRAVPGMTSATQLDRNSLRFAVLGPSFNTWQDLKWPCRRVWYCRLHCALRHRLGYSLSTSITLLLASWTHRHTTNEWMSCSRGLWVFRSSTLGFVRSASAGGIVLWLRDIYATTCDGSFCSEVTLPEEKHGGQNSHIRKDLMLGCIGLDPICWLLLCPI